MLLFCSFSLIDWSELIIKLLAHYGFQYKFIAPGARSSLLARAALLHGNCVVHFDERSLAFAALGVGKASQIQTSKTNASKTKAILIVTSGTAVGNLWPAVMEASLSQTSLILLTADRPYELRDTSANQTLDQVKLFNGYVRWQFDVPPPHHELDADWLASTLAYAAFKASDGPVHLNLMFREPFASYPIPMPKKLVEYVPASTATGFEWSLDWQQKGLFIVAQAMDDESFHLLLQLAQQWSWPILVEVFCHARYQYKHSCVIAYHETICHQTMPFPDANIIIQFGERLISNHLITIMKKVNQYVVVSSSTVRVDPLKAVTTRICVTNVQSLLKFWFKTLRPTTKPQWLSWWQHLNFCVGYKLRQYFAQEIKLSEPGVLRMCFQYAKPLIFVGNSMPIRDANHFVECHHLHDPVHVFANRGVSGIDGNLATSMGVSYALQEPLMCILGDLAFLHDLTSLHLLRQLTKHIWVIVINNQGGGIFELIPNVFNHYFHHHDHFEHVAKQFDFHYYAVNNWYELALHLQNTKGANLIEIQTNQLENATLHKKLTQYTNLFSVSFHSD
jgi:2-succinyl-5-enolpyruvyl-6-hydroxy-3-cyclohexene-1-carboxylate synthase